jgi:glyoxylate reductase
VPYRIVITRPLPGRPDERLAQAGLPGPIDLWINPRDEKLERPTLLETVRGAHAVLVTPADMLVNGEFFDAAGPDLVIVSAYAVGVDNIDVAEATRRGILVGHTPDAVTEPTADLTWLLILAAARRAREGLDLVRSGRWTGVRPNDPAGQRLIGKTLLIIGAGRIGLAVARRAAGWRMSLLYHSRSRHEEWDRPPFGARRVSLEDGLRQADIVSLHCPLTPHTRHLINAARLAMMKPTAILVNTSRGPVVDEAALVEALRGGTIAAAGLDVFEQEPLVHPGLLALDNAFLMPHWGSTTSEDRAWMTRIAIDNISAALRGEQPPHAVNDVRRDAAPAASR